MNVIVNSFQVSLTSVQVSWHGLATRVECADQFIVKSWLARNPNDYKMSDLLQTSQYSFVVEDLLPNQDYVFQVRKKFLKGEAICPEFLRFLLKR